MTTTADLAQQLGTLSLASSHQPGADSSERISTSGTTNDHLLTFDFPALDLLDDKNELYLPEPHLIDFRPRPEAFMFHLAMWDPLEFFYALGSTAPNFDPSNIDNEHPVTFLTAVEALGNLKGSSIMSIVVHVENVVPEIRVRLSTTSDSSGTTKTMFWDFSVEDWEAIMAPPLPWVEVLGDVVYRKTTRSFLAAEEKMRQYSTEMHQDESVKWLDLWGAGSPRSAKKLLVRYLQYLQTDKVLPFDRLEEDAAIHLACGHEISITKEAIEALSDGECLNATCILCGTRILPTAAYDEAAIFEQQYRILEASDADDAWARLHAWITDDCMKPFSRTALRDAIPAAIDSLVLPEIIESKHMCPALFKQTSLALEALNEWLEQRPETICASPYDLVHDLEDVALEAVLEAGLAFPATWCTFLKIALNRAVNLTTLRRCSKLGDGHEGVHMHGRQVFVTVPFVQDGDGSFDLGDLGEALDMEVDDE